MSLSRECEEEEHRHPGYAKVKAAEITAINTDDYNIPGIADEVPDGSLPDAFGRPVDHGGGGRHRERAEQKIEALREQQKKLRR